MDIEYLKVTETTIIVVGEENIITWNLPMESDANAKVEHWWVIVSIL